MTRATNVLALAAVAGLVVLAVMFAGREGGGVGTAKAAPAGESKESSRAGSGDRLVRGEDEKSRQEIQPAEDQPAKSRSLTELYGVEHPLGKLGRRDLEIALSYWHPDVYELRLAELRDHMDPSDSAALLKEAQLLQWIEESRAVSDALLRGSYFVEKEAPNPPRAAKPGHKLQTTTVYFEGKPAWMTVVLSEKRYPGLAATAEHRRTQRRFHAHHAADSFNALAYAEREKIFARYKAIRAKRLMTEEDAKLMRRYFPAGVWVKKGSLTMKVRNP